MSTTHPVNVINHHKKGLVPYFPVRKPPYTVEAPDAVPVEGETLPRRSIKAKNGLLNTPTDDVTTVYDIIKRSARVHAARNAIGWRKLVRMHTETKKVPKMVDGVKTEVDKKWQYFELSPYQWLTYKEWEAYVIPLGSGLRQIGMQAGDKLHIFAASGRDWMALAHGCATQSMTIVTAYDSLGESGVEHSLVQTDAAAMFLDPHLIKTALKPLEKATTVKTVIYNEDSLFGGLENVDVLKKARPDLRVLSVKELHDLGVEHAVEPVPPSPDDLYCIMYTSGSTGLPKGVEMTHGGLIAGLTGLASCVEESVSHEDVTVCYLPLAHIFELCLENLILFAGVALGYGNPRTISDTSMRNCLGDIRELRPTALVGVPQVWETIKKGVIQKLNEVSPLARFAFWASFRYKSVMVANHMPLAQLLDGIAFQKVRELTGGRIRLLMNGASGISNETRHFLSMVIAPMIVGYGLTETCACGALGSPFEYTRDAIGPLPASIEVKLVSLPDMSYFADSKPPQGEIYIRGRPLLRGYFRNPEETEKALTRDGWFKTGDIGEFDDVGHLKVIDRTKNLMKLQGGEYIALEKLETVYRSCQLVTTLMIDGSPDHPRPIAVVVPNDKALADKARELGVDVHAMHHDNKVNAALLKELQAVAKSSGLTPLETVAAVIVSDEEWTPESGLVTASQKLNRRAIREQFKTHIKQCFASLSS